MLVGGSGPQDAPPCNRSTADAHSGPGVDARYNAWFDVGSHM